MTISFTWMLSSLLPLVNFGYGLGNYHYLCIVRDSQTLTVGCHTLCVIPSSSDTLLCFFLLGQKRVKVSISRMNLMLNFWPKYLKLIIYLELIRNDLWHFALAEIQGIIS